MNFSEWTKKRKNKQVDLQETTKEPSVAPAAKASSFAEWTRNKEGQTSQSTSSADRFGQSRQESTQGKSKVSKNAGPQSFSEWIRRNRGDSTWREEDVAVQQRNDYISDYTQRANREFSAKRNRYVAPETAARQQSAAESQAKTAKNAGTEILKTMRQSGRYSDEETRRALERLTAGDDVMESIRKNAENDSTFRSQFQSEDQYNSWKKWQDYENLRSNADFAEKSRYRSTANGNEAKANQISNVYGDLAIPGTAYSQTGYDDVLYDAINGDKTAQKRQRSSWSSADYDFDSIPEDTKALFNYIYATQGQDAAYDYLDGAVQQRYNGIQALGYGMAQGTGVPSLAALAGEGIAAAGGVQEIKDRNREWYGDFLRDSQGAREQNKAAYSVGNVAGNLGMMYALGGITGGLTGSAGKAAGSAAAKGLAAKGAGKAAQYIVGETVSKAVTSGLSYMAADAVRNSGTYATGNMSGADYWKSLGISGAQGMANGLVNGLVNSGIADVLRRSGNMTLFAEFVRQTVAGTASAAAGMETGYALRGERPDDAQVATDLATAFAFSVLQSAVSSYQTSQANKSAMEAAVREIQSRYSAMTENWDNMTPEQRADTAARIGIATQQLRADLNSYYIAGQQNTVNDLNAALEIIEHGMGNYISGFTAANGAATASYGGNFLGGESYDFSGATSKVGADVAHEMQSAVEQGLALAKQGGGFADLPAQDAGVPGSMGAAAATVRTGSDILAQAAREAANGGTVSNTTAQEILADPEAVSTLEEAAGLVVSDEMTKAQQRRAVKSAVEALASSQGESTQPQSEIIPLGESTPQEAQTGPEPQEEAPSVEAPRDTRGVSPQDQTPEAQRTEAIMVQDAKAVADFGTTLGKAGETALTKMYDPQTQADSYIRGMVDYYNAGAQGLDFDKVQTTGTLAEPQKEAAYLAGNADADSNMINGGQNDGSAEEPAEVHLRNGSQRNYGTDSGGELRELEGGAGQNPGWHVETQPADAGAAALSYGQEVSTASLGFSGGLEDDAIHLVTGGDTEATSAARSLAESRGLEVTFFGGGNLSIRREDGGIASARAAYVDGNRLYVRADHPEFTAEQLTRHEVGHDMLEKGEIDRDKTMARARELLGDQRFQESIGQYEAAYRGSGLTPEDVRDEVICDSLGGMNIFHGISGMEETAQNILDASFVATEEQKQANGTRGPPEGKKNTAMSGGEKYSEARLYEDVDLSKDGRVYTYDFLTSLPNMKVVTLPEIGRLRGSDNRIETGAVARSGMENARAVGMVQDGKTYVQNRYTGHNLRIDNSSVRHGLNGGQNRLLTNSRLGAVIGDVVKNAVPINALHNKANNVIGTYAMAGYAVDSAGREFVSIVTVEQRSGEITGVESYDVTHAVSGRQKNRSERVDTKSQGVYPSTNASDVKIADFLSIVKQTHQSILSEDVLDRMGLRKNPAGFYTKQVKFSMETPVEETKDLVAHKQLLSQDLPELENLRKENQRLQAQVESWKGQLKRTTPENRTVRQKDVDKLAKRLISSYDSTLDTAEVSADLKKLGEYIVRGGDGKNELTWDAVHDLALTIGRKLVENALAADDSAYKAYTELRKYLRDTKITIGPEYANDIPDFKAFKDSYKGKLRLSLGDKTNVDQVYQELSENWPELFSETGEAHPTDQILRISDVLDGLTPIYENPHSYDMDRAAEYAAGDILDSIMGEDVRQEPPTFADKQARKLEDAVAREREKRNDAVLAEKMAAGRELAQQARKSKEAIAAERAIRDQKLQALKDHYQEIQDRRRERREDSNARTRLLKIAKRLRNKKLPAVNRALLDQYIGDLDTAAKSMTGKTLENLSELQSWYTGQKENNPDFIADPNVEKALSRLQKRQISNMTADEVRELTDVLLNIENEIRTQRKLIDSQDRRDVYHMGQDVIRDVYNTKGSKGGFLDKYLVTETLSPVRQIRRMTGYVDTDPLYVLTQGLADGQRDMMAYQMRSSRPFEKFANDKKFNERFSGKKAEGIEVRGVTIQGQNVKVNITPAMRVSLYLHSLNDDNLRHIAGGGVTIPDEKLYRKGDMGEAYARAVTIRMTPSDIRAITSQMTDQERSFARAVQKYFNEDSKTALNEVSEKLKGYPVAEVENYFPINTDSNFTRSEFESLKRDGTIEGMGFLKERVVAKNPILLRDANDVVDQAIRMHGKYVGLAIPVRNFNKVWNVTTTAYGEDGSSAYPTGSVQSAIESRWGKTGTKYVDKLMGDLQGSTQTKNVWAKALNKVKGNYAQAVLTLNLSVAMKQAASYPTAAAVLGWKPLAQAMTNFGKVDLGLIEKYTPLQWYRSKGFSTKELGDMKSSGKSLPQGLNWVQGVDLITTRKLWKASEYYVQDYQKGLTVGSDEYYKAVAQIYNRVIEETQPNYTIMQRPQLLRSDDTLMGNLAMFKTQPFQNTGIVYDAIGNYLAKAEQAKYGGEEAKAEAKTAKRDMGWAITSQLGQLAVFAGMTMVWALARGKKDKYADEDGNLTAGSVLSAVGKDMVGGALSGIPFGSDAWELASSKLFGDKYYGLDAVTVTAIQDTLEAMNNLTDQLGRIGKAALTGGEINWNSERLKLDRELDSISKTVGIPYENVMNLGKIAVRQTVVRALGQNVGEYAYLKLTTDPEKYSGDYYDVLYKAMGNNREDYEKIYQDMLEFGFDEDKIRNAIEKRMKEDQGVKNVSDLDHRYLSPTQEDSWDSVYEGLSGSSLWGSATKAQRDAVEDKLYNVVTQNTAGQKIQEKIDGGAAYGLDETEYMLYLLALSMADKPTESGKMGTYTNDEVAEAIRMVPGLTDEERSYLWTAQGKSDKRNPWG